MTWGRWWCHDCGAGGEVEGNNGRAAFSAAKSHSAATGHVTEAVMEVSKLYRGGTS